MDEYFIQFFFLNYRNLHVYTRVFKHINRVFKSGFSGRLASDNRKFHENRSFPNSLKALSELTNFNRILIKFKPPNQGAQESCQ